MDTGANTVVRVSKILKALEKEDPDAIEFNIW